MHAKISEIDLRYENFVSVVEKHSQQREEWCTVATYDQNYDETIKDKYHLVTDKVTINQLVWQIYSWVNRSLLTPSHMPRGICHVQLKRFNAVYRPGSDATLIITNYEGYTFLTCYGEPYISLNFYLTPFKPELWVTLGITICTIIALVIGAQRICSLLEQQPFSIWMFV